MSGAGSPSPSPQTVAAWGRLSASTHAILRPSLRADVPAALSRGANRCAVRGLGRSYGDVALNPEGALLDMTGLDRFMAFDPATGELEVEAGVSLGEILAAACRPNDDGSGWFLPVTPGTGYVTVGGAIANDVHGKNHHRAGSFGRYVLGLTVARSNGRIIHCGPDREPGLFSATVGGLGLTGVILAARLQLRRVAGLAVESEHLAFNSLDEFFNLTNGSEADWEYTVGWVDALATGKAAGRGIFSRARHAPNQRAAPPPHLPRLSIPATPPFSLVNRASVRLFNAFYWRSARSARRTEHYARTLYPLDGIGNWNRLYGPRGFFQFQCVVPKNDARAVLGELLGRIAASGEGSMLTVIKTFNDMPSPGLLSFPMPGTTLAVDFANRGEGTRALLADLERLTVEARGRIYPAKDAVMSAETFNAGYGHALAEFRRHMDPGLTSAFARRVGLESAS